MQNLKILISITYYNINMYVVLNINRWQFYFHFNFYNNINIIHFLLKKILFRPYKLINK